MKIALAQLNYHIGNFESNVSKVKDTLAIAKGLKADLVVFSELALCGYPPRDFLEFDDFIGLCTAATHSIALQCNGIAAIVGAPGINPKAPGKKLFNSAYFLAGGKIQSVHHKALLPTYDVFDEYRYFEPAATFQVARFREHKIAITICEDLWDVDDERVYTVCPMDELASEFPGFIVNISASPFSYNHAEKRKEVFTKNASKYGLPLFFVNHVGAQTELIFDGGSMVIDGNGNVVDELKYFEEDLRVYDLDKIKNGKKKRSSGRKTFIFQDAGQKIPRIHDALVLGIRDYFRKLDFTKSILGLSGGIDSAVTLVLASRALGSENVTAVLLPSKYTSPHSERDALQLVEKTGCPHEVIGIEEIAGIFNKTLNPLFKNRKADVTEENIQARIRAVLLMALSNKFGVILLNTSNKSEAAVGYGTLYGDMCGGLSVLGDVYKTEIYQLAEYINKKGEIIPADSITKPPSAELRYNQKDTDELPEYDILDRILFNYIELRKGPKEIIALGYKQALVKKILKMVNATEWKRYQTPPILRVSPKAFGMGRRMPIVGKYLA